MERVWQRQYANHAEAKADIAYSGERDRSFWSIVTAAHEMVLRG